jgi:hypothetical protein
VGSIIALAICNKAGGSFELFMSNYNTPDGSCSRYKGLALQVRAKMRHLCTGQEVAKRTLQNQPHGGAEAGRWAERAKKLMTE